MAHILIIDDTKNIRTMIARALTHSGHHVETAESGEQGLVIFGDGSQWDLTLVDQRMPQMTGEEFVVEARKRDPMARIVMITAFATPELAAQVIQTGALDFLRKPFTTDVLRDTVALALAQERHVSPASAFDAAPVLPEPGQPDYPLPSLSWRINGFSFWPFAGAPSETHPPAFALGRLFHVRAPGGSLHTCFVGVTPHVRAQIEDGEVIPDDDTLWDKICGQSLFRFISEQAQTPPDVLPIYETYQKTLPSGGGFVQWGAFFGK